MSRLSLTILLFCLLFPLAAFAQPSPGAPGEPAGEAVAELSAQRAAAERSKMFQTGLLYSRWLDRVAEQSQHHFLQERVFDRVTWMHVLACAAALALIALHPGGAGGADCAAPGASPRCGG